MLGSLRCAPCRLEGWAHGLAEQPGAAPPGRAPSPAGAGFWSWGSPGGPRLVATRRAMASVTVGQSQRKRNSGTFCYCNPDSETDEDEEEGDEQQRLLNTPRRYGAGRGHARTARARTCWAAPSAGLGMSPGGFGGCGAPQPVKSRTSP